VANPVNPVDPVKKKHDIAIEAQMQDFQDLH
jgi:hypothetical protein